MSFASGVSLKRAFAHVDFFLFGAALALALLGLVTMRPFAGYGGAFFDKQAIWIVVSIVAFLIASLPEYQFLRRTPVVSALFAAAVALLVLIFAFGAVAKGAQSWFDLGLFAIQPTDLAKLVLIIVLAKYFARRHIEIANFRHIFISGAYAFLICALVFLQPDFGGAIIIASIWLGMVLVAGISWKHLAALMLVALLAGGALWSWGLEPYQKDRVLTFVNPLADIQGAGYSVYQSTVAIGSGELTGKGIGYGTQSKLRFLPEYQTDFVFAAYAEEWGFVGILILFGLFAILMVRILGVALRAGDHFTALFAAGVAIMLVCHFLVHVGLNLGLLPVTGTTIPFMSYGGSHLVVEFLALGILMGLRRHARPVIRAKDQTEFIGAI